MFAPSVFCLQHSIHLWLFSRLVKSCTNTCVVLVIEQVSVYVFHKKIRHSLVSKCQTEHLLIFVISFGSLQTCKLELETQTPHSSDGSPSVLGLDVLVVYKHLWLCSKLLFCILFQNKVSFLTVKFYTTELDPLCRSNYIVVVCHVAFAGSTGALARLPQDKIQTGVAGSTTMLRSRVWTC